MKKFITFFALAALALVGCKKEIATGVLGGDQTVTFSVVAADATKADVTPIPATIDTCVAVVRMYDAYDVLIGDVYASPKCTKDGQSYKFSVDLMGGQKYEVTVLMYTKGVYTVDSKLEAIKRAAAELPYNLHPEHDMFSASITYEAGDNTPLIIAKRPFAQLNLITTDLVQNFVPVVTVKYTAPDTFNAVTGEASGERVYETLGVFTPDADAPNQCTISSDYIFASDEKSLISVEMTAEKVGKFVRTFDNLPLQRNYKTNVIGKLLSVNAPFTVQVNADWGDPDNDIHWQSAENIAAANAILAAATAGEDLNIKVNMPKDAAAQKITFTTKNSNTNTTFKFENNFASESTADKTITFTKDADATVMPASVTIEAPAGTHLVFEKATHAVINGTEYASISGSFTVSTLVINKGVHVGTIDMTAGGLEIHGTVDHFIAHEGHGEIIVRDCEGLSEEVYNALKEYIAPNYCAVENETNPKTYDIVLNAVAEINGVIYATLSDAVAAANSGDVITLCKEVKRVPMMASSEQYGDIALYIDGKQITLDLNGYNVTVPMSDPESGVCFWGANSGKIKIIDSSEGKSGTFDYGGRYIAANSALMILGGSYNFKLTSSYCQVGDEPVQVGERWTVGHIFDKGTGSQTDPFSVDTKEQFLKLQSVDLRNYNLNGSNTRVYFKVNTDLEFTESVGESSYSYCIITQLINSEIDFAKGNGENHTVTLPEEVCLLGNVFGGCLKNVNVNLNEESIVSLIAGPFEFNNVCASGEVTPTNNTGAYVTYVQGTHVSFTDCISNVEMYGSGGANNYNSVFVGYVYNDPVNLDFTNCVNKGSLVCGKASMFIGNPNAATIVLNVTNCVNEGTIKATYVAVDYNFNYYFSTSSNNYKFVLNAVEYNHNNSLPTSYMPNALEDNCVINRGVVENGPENTGLVLSRNEDKTFTITPATGNEIGGKAVHHYTVGLGLYTGISNGSCLFFATETISSDGSASYTTTLKDYKFVDISFVNGAEMGELAGNRTFTKDGETYYVVLDDETVRGEHGAAPAQMYYLSAFDADNKLLASVSLSDSQPSMIPFASNSFKYSNKVKESFAPTAKVSIAE